MFITVKFGPKFAFNSSVARCEVQALYKEFNIKRTFVGATYKEAFEKFKNYNENHVSKKIS